jgi:hypothetical protein
MSLLDRANCGFRSICMLIHIVTMVNGRHRFHFMKILAVMEYRWKMPVYPRSSGFMQSASSRPTLAGPQHPRDAQPPGPEMGVSHENKTNRRLGFLAYVFYSHNCRETGDAVWLCSPLVLRVPPLRTFSCLNDVCRGC